MMVMVTGACRSSDDHNHEGWKDSTEGCFTALNSIRAWQIFSAFVCGCGDQHAGLNGKHGKALRPSDNGGAFTSLNYPNAARKDTGSYFSKYAWQNGQIASQISMHENSCTDVT